MFANPQAMTPITKSRSKNLPLAPKPHAGKAMAKRLTLWTEEINFYHSVLMWSIFNVDADRKSELQQLLDKMKKLRNDVIPALKSELKVLETDKKGSLSKIALRMNSTEKKLIRLKSEIFKQADHLVRTPIW